MNYTDTFEALWAQVEPFTTVTKAQGFALHEAVNHTVRADIRGAFVDCGVGQGGSSMVITLTLLGHGITDRVILLFDPFAGDADLTQVQANIRTTGYPPKAVGYIKGDTARTLPHERIKKIALLRLNSDSFDAMTAQLAHLYPAASAGAPVILTGCAPAQDARKAVDAFLDAERSAGRAHFLAPLDDTTRMFIKPATITTDNTPKTPDVARHDYIAPGLKDPHMVARFTHLERVDPRPVAWPYLRREVPHIWRNDTRSARRHIGVQSVDEGALLYNAALPFAGKRGLEIGCHLAFSTAHLLDAGLDLDVIDPMLATPIHLGHVQDSLDRAVPGHGARLHAGYSPGIVGVVQAADRPAKWHFAFIDGLHDGTAPLDDARAVEPLMASTAAVMFHDLTCPDVAAGLRHFAQAGWHTRIYETMQVMAIAWRGTYTPPDHIGDVGTDTKHLDHLSDWHS